MKYLLSVLAVVTCFTAFSAAQAQFETTTVTTTETITQPGIIDSTAWLRAGPDPEYPVVATIYDGQNLDIYGCVDGYEWCDVQADGARGWISGRYLLLPQYHAPIIEYGPRIVTLPIVVFHRDEYWPRYYQKRDFYHNWYATHPRHEAQSIIINEQSRQRPIIIRKPAPRAVIINNNIVDHETIHHQPVISNRPPVSSQHPVVIRHDTANPHRAAAVPSEVHRDYKPVIGSHFEDNHISQLHPESHAVHREEHHDDDHHDNH